MNSLEIKDKRNQLKKRAKSIIATCKKEVRELTDDELKEVENIKSEIAKLDDELKALKEKLANYDFGEEEDVEEDRSEEVEEEKEENENKENNTDKRNMKKKSFSLLRTIRSIVNNQPLDKVDLAVIQAGQKEARKSGINVEGQIQLPCVENRATISVNAEGEDLVATDVFDIMQPLRAKNVLVQAGAKVYSNLVGNVKIPVMTGSSVSWEGENSAASDGGAAFSHVDLSPKRLTCYVDVSKTLLAQDSVGVEEALRNDIISAVNSKLEATILGDAAGSATQPEGIFHAVAPVEVSDFAGIVENEAEVEDANVIGECKYVMSNKAKAAMRAMVKGANTTALVYENGAVDGTEAFNTSHVGGTNYVYGDFSNLVIGSWASTDVIVDPYTQAGNNAVRLVVNAYFDASIARPSAFAAGEIIEGE